MSFLQNTFRFLSPSDKLIEGALTLCTWHPHGNPSQESNSYTLAVASLSAIVSVLVGGTESSSDSVECRRWTRNRMPTKRWWPRPGDQVTEIPKRAAPVARRVWVEALVPRCPLLLETKIRQRLFQWSIHPGGSTCWNPLFWFSSSPTTFLVSSVR